MAYIIGFDSGSFLMGRIFYMKIVDEVNDEVDDTLEDYSEGLIIRALSGEDMPASSNGSNNQYYLYEVSESYAMAHPQITYRDEMVFITERMKRNRLVC